MFSFDSGYWALIIGGSSGFGLACARKLSRHGMNLYIVHRDRKGAMSRIEPLFAEMRSNGVKVVTFNADATAADTITRVLDGLEEMFAGKDKIRMVLHSIAFGNLKLLVPFSPPDTSKEGRNLLARRTDVLPERVSDAVQALFEEGADALHPLADPPAYANDLLLDAGDFSRTIQAMGSNIVEWVQETHRRGLFAADARVLSLTSEGNAVAWRGYAAVSAAKAVLESVSRSMAVEFAPYGIRSNVIQAGVTDTAALRAIPGSRQISSRARLRNPFGRLTQPEDVADIIFLLCQDEAAWINGALICADGGERVA
jgi:NAD(P)-dependent dehydrogenase (short-subunit alcohol dehydrogenase family)